MLRLSCNWNYDTLSDMATNHLLIRQFLGHGLFDTAIRYPRQTLRDNLWWFDMSLFEQINEVIVKYGMSYLASLDRIGQAEVIPEIHGRCDSFVLETDIHYPTELNLLRDSLRKVLTIIGRFCNHHSIEGWSDYKKECVVIRGMCRSSERLMRYRPKLTATPSKKNFFKKQQELFQQVEKFLDKASLIVTRAHQTLPIIEKVMCSAQQKIVNRLTKYIAYVEKFSDQVQRRVFTGESIPHSEKVFSIFEEHTELIRKGKVGVPQEFGVRVCVCVLEESKYGFILQHMVMEGKEDEKVTVSMIEETQSRFPLLKSCSFDTNFYTPDNLATLQDKLDTCVMPSRGKKRLAHELTEDYAELRKKHSAVESAIHALENHGLDKCPDNGIEGFKRYVHLAVIARNIQILGARLQARELEELKKKRKRLKVKKVA